MKSHLIITVLSGWAVMALSGCQPNVNQADVLFINAQIVHPEGHRPGQAIAVMDGKIAAMGAVDSITQIWRSDSTVDLSGVFLYPGFIDAHAHFLSYGLSLQHVDLRGTTSWDEVMERTVAFAAEHSPKFIEGRGWDQNDWPDQQFPDRAKLDSAFPDIPVVLTRIDGHAAIANAAALDYAGILPGTQVEGGIAVQKNRRLTGLLIDRAVELVHPPEPARSLRINALLDAEEQTVAAGLTTIVDAGLGVPDINLIDSLHRAQALKTRIYAMVSDHPEALDYYTENGPYKTARLNVRSFKFYGDGALGSRGACLLEPYHDDPENYGLLVTRIDHLRESARRLHAAGFQMNTHAIGDSANRLILDVYADILEPGNDLRWRIEHAQVVDPQDFDRFGSRNIIPSVQPTHATSDMYWAEERLGPERIRTAYAYNDLREKAALVALGTDFPIEDIDPLKTYYAAVVRKDGRGYPDGGYQRENALSRDDALRGMTEWAAYANFEETEKGRVEAGMYADFTILDTDLIFCAEEQILKAQVIYTVIGGQIVYSHKN